MEMLKKIAEYLRSELAASANAAAEILNQYIVGVPVMDIRLSDAEGDYPSWWIRKDRRSDGYHFVDVGAEGYPAIANMSVRDDGGEVEISFSTVSSHGVNFHVVGNQVHVTCDGNQSSRFWGDCLFGDWASEYRERGIRHRLFGDRKPNFEFFLKEAGHANTVGRAWHNVLEEFGLEQAGYRVNDLKVGQLDDGWEADLEWIIRNFAGEVEERHGFEMSKADVENAISLAKIRVRVALEAKEKEERKAREDERRNTPGTRAWRRHQRRLGLLTA
jgi:hypothetical protein